ncbi:D-Ala-D-Ala carboxypeptidase family metallohydrolase [Prevotella sp. P6B4]|uniref:D-Ala-D-Ala carboxypeptidase family metallohydrolase n=1 Tax=Prevotella sp. P6B4 TaxID=1410614 RepID=UPI000686F4D4|nr:D-Ala-D-Ala carboxypeptidase family metallohydrolase [Prevotella sp. P6B4]
MNNVSINLSEHFSLAELTKTNVKLNNVPNEAQVANLKRLCGWLEMLRSEWNSRYGGGNDPIIINSAFRSPQVNKAVGGVATSNHLTGGAADIKVKDICQLIRYATILLDIADESQEDFDELLIERNDSGAIWLHFAVRQTGNRRKVLLI